MKMTGKILISMSFFVLFVIIFSGAVSAANWTVNPGDSIQSVINNASANDTIIVNNNNGTAHTYTENIIVNKTLTLQAVPGGNVTVQALNPNQPVFTINADGSGSNIQNFIITGVNGYWRSGIYIDNSNNNIISGNTISSNGGDGILISMGSNNTVSGNNITYNQGNGIYIWNSLNNTVYGNIISNNYFGFYIYVYDVYDSPAADISFNKITQNCLGLYIEDGMVNAQNNWWGSNNPVESYNYPTDIFIDWGVVNYNPWLVLKINATPDSISDQNSIITTDLTHNNQGTDTSFQGHVPDNISVNFTTNLGTVTGTVYTLNGQANATFNRGTSSSGIAYIMATLDNQTVQTNVTLEEIIDSQAPSVSANVPGGIYNTTKMVTLTATDNVDSNPAIYYTLDGSTPTTSSIKYTTPINICNYVTTLNFMALDSAGNQAPIQTINYTINLPIINKNTQKVYSKIQDAINEASISDVIQVNNGTYTENIVVNKTLTLQAVPGGNVTVQALNQSIPVLFINSGASGSIIQGLNIKGATSSDGIYLNSCNNCLLTGNAISNNQNGVNSYYSSFNEILNNNIVNNSWNGIVMQSGFNNTISGNNITSNGNGVQIGRSFNNTFSSNMVSYNSWIGFYTFDDSEYMNYINFNSIAQNGESGIYSEGGVFNATNNWWGSNNPIEGFYYGDDIAIDWGTVYYDPWLVLNVSSDPDTINENSTYSTITADLTYDNHGNDTFPSGHIPDGIPLNFITNIGTITSTAYTSNGKANSTFNRGTITSGTANITVILDKQSSQTNVTIYNNIIDSQAPSVSANVPGGIYNTTKTVTLTATDNLDTNPVIYYSLNNGTTWSNQVKTVTLNLNQGVTNLKFYARDATGNTCPNQTLSYTIDMTAPTVVANPAGGTYNTTKFVTLTATDNLDPNPNIYYTTNGSIPTISSTKYTGPINVVSTTTLKFIAVDAAGNQAAVQTQNYTFNFLITNINTGRGFNSIQAAIDDSLTLNGHTLEILSGIYTENVVVNKKLTINPVSGGNVIIQAADLSNPVFTINSGGSASCINGLTIKSATNSIGILLNSVMGCTIHNNTIYDNNYGINIFDSSFNNITQNQVKQNNYGLYLTTQCISLEEFSGSAEDYYFFYEYSGVHSDSQGNIIKDNSFTNNYYGLYLKSDECPSSLSEYDNHVLENDIAENNYGIYAEGGLMWTSDVAYIHFNRIENNTLFGIYLLEIGADARNNWWGSSDGPTVSYQANNDICEICEGEVEYCYYDPWIVLTLNSYDIVSHDSSSSVIADLNHNNQGIDISSLGTVPNGLLITFNTTLGSINSPVPTINGTSVANFNSGAQSGTATVSAILDAQTVSKTITNIVGIYNQRTQKSFTTIQAAINDATTLNGDTILVGGDNYTENVIVDKQLILMSAYGKNVTVQAMNSSQPVFIVYSSGSTIQGFNIKGYTNYGIFLYQVNNCNITGNCIINSSGGIFIYYSNYTSIIGNNATNNTDNGIYSYYSNNTMMFGNNIENNGLNGIFIEQSNNNTISDNNVINNTLKGIYVDNSDNTSLIGNNVTDNIQIGILLNNSTSSLLSENNVENNGLNETFNGGIIIGYSNDTTLSKNNMANNTENGIFIFNSNDNSISLNNVINNTLGIKLQNATNNTLSLNNVTNNVLGGVFLLYSSSSLISDNNITNNLNTGIYLDNSDNTEISENTITDNYSGIKLYFSPTTTVNFNRIVGNTVFGLGNAYSSFVNATNNWWGTNTPTASSSNSSDIYILGGNIIYSPWIVLTVNSVYYTDGIFNITTNLTCNNEGTDTSSLGHVPDGIIASFTTDYGTIGETAYTINGKATSPLNYSTATNLANVTVTVDNQILFKTVNLFKVYNTVTQQGFTTIQAAIDDVSTSDGDVIEVTSGIYNENILLHKHLTITSTDGDNPMINGTITINSGGSNSIIQGFAVKKIYINSSNNNTISNNIISNQTGVSIYNSNDNNILNNIISQNSGNGISIQYGCNNTISGNIITCNTYGININRSYNNMVYSNIISNNTWFGINIFDYSGHANYIRFNQIAGNGLYGLYAEEGLINATNNWWGTNNPTESLSGPCDVAIEYGTVCYEPYLVLNVTADPTAINNNSTITADLTHNSDGADTSSQGHIPDNIPVNFTTTLGTLTSPVYTRNGKAIVIFNVGIATSGIANVITTLDNQSLELNITVDTVVPTVNATLDSGLYTTTQSVNLTASDNLDPTPIIYYTTDGSTPTVSSTIYTTPITITTTTTLKFMAVDFTGNQSPIDTLYYIFLSVGNLNTGMGYSSIQNAIDDNLTVDGDVIVVGNGTYTENILVNKNLTIMPYDGNVTIQAANPNNPVITINSSGNEAMILGFTITGATGISSSGIYLNQANNCTIIGNTLTNNYYGLLLTSSPDNLIWDNNLTGNLMDAIRLNSSNNNTIYSNTITNNTGTGIYLDTSDNTLVMANTIQNNSMNGIELDTSNNTTIYENTITGNNQNGVKATSSSADINFNIITGSGVYGFYNLGNSTVNATNNWWGSNSPLVSSTSPSDINIAAGTVTYDPWLVLSLTGSNITVTHNSTSDSEITADLTQNNQGEDTSSLGIIPDGLSVNFTTTRGTINSTAIVQSGVAEVTLTSSPSDGATTVNATLDNYSVSGTFRKSFSNIQDAVSDALTVDGDVILVTNGTYTENIVVTKNLTIVSEGNVTVQASNPSSPVFTVNNCSDVIIYGFNITGATQSSAIYLNNANNCYIMDNTITDIGLESTGAFGYGIFMNSTTNCTVSGNVLENNLGGIDLEYSNNTLLSGNNVTNCTYHGIVLFYSDNSTISQNSLSDNNCGVFSQLSNGLVIVGNDIKNNTGRGIFLYYSSGDVHFNRVIGSGYYGLYIRGGTVNATNNWWGTNYPNTYGSLYRDIYVYSGTLYYDPWLVLTVTPTSYKVSEGKVYEATITADLNHNSDGEEVSTVVYTPDGIPVTFTSDNNSTITNTSYTEDGKASVTLVLDSSLESGLTNVNATLDVGHASTCVDRIAKATITIVSSAIDLSTNQTLYLTYEVPLNESVSWVSVLYKSTSNDFGTFTNEVDLIVNGEVVLSTTVTNLNYFNNKDVVSEEIWYNINFLNWLFSESEESEMALQAIIYNNPELENLTGSELETGILSIIQEKYGFSDSEILLLQYREYFTDEIQTNITYTGDAAKLISFEDPDTGEITGLNLPGNPISRVSTMIYANGGYYHVDDVDNPTSIVYKNEGYEGVRSFAITTTQVTDEILQYWLDQKDATDSNGSLLYPEGPMKAAYGTFLESLLVISCHDMVADAAATTYNVTWTRTTPIVVSVCDDAYATYITGEMDHRMGMDVVGDADNVKAFRYACSSSFSTIEYWVGSTLFPSDNSTSNLLGSVTMGLGYLLLNGEALEIFESNGYTIIRAVGDNQRILIIDPKTGIVMDVGTLDLNDTISGTRCYGDQQTEWATDLAEGILNYGQAIMDVLNGNGSIDLSQLTTNTRTGLIGFVSSVVISLQWAENIIDSVSSNLFSTFTSWAMVGLAVNNACINNEIGKNNYTNIYGSNYPLSNNNFTLEEAKSTYRTYKDNGPFTNASNVFVASVKDLQPEPYKQGMQWNDYRIVYGGVMMVGGVVLVGGGVILCGTGIGAIIGGPMALAGGMIFSAGLNTVVTQVVYGRTWVPPNTPVNNTL